MKDARYFDCLFGHPVHNDVGQRREDQFSTSGRATAGPAKVWEILQPGTALKDGSCYAASHSWIVTLDAFANALQILRRGPGPADLHQN
jgi:hypothetical protein